MGNRRGYTLVELMIASVIMLFALTSVFGLMLSMQRMLATAAAENELALAGRELREKLMFHVSPPVAGSSYAGLLSATNHHYNAQMVEGGAKLLARTARVGAGSFHDQEIQLLLAQRNGKTFFINDSTPDKDAHRGWLWPGRFSLTENSIDAVVNAVGTQYETRRLDFDFGLVTPKQGSIPRTVRREVFRIPLLGRLQREDE